MKAKRKSNKNPKVVKRIKGFAARWSSLRSAQNTADREQKLPARYVYCYISFLFKHTPDFIVHVFKSILPIITSNIFLLIFRRPHCVRLSQAV